MKSEEIRYRLISTLLQAGGPLDFEELARRCEAASEDIRPVLRGLIESNLVIEGDLVSDGRKPQYCWAVRWAEEAERRVADSKQKLESAVRSTGVTRERELHLDSGRVLAFYNYVINEYRPPEDKRFLVFLQCSVRRPFSSSPSHASMRRAISAATGFDPSKNFERCSVHVVVLASKIGPVPYELEGTSPANVRGGGVKHFDRAYYARAKPILAKRMAKYITAHGENYEHIATFTEGRYGEVMEEAREIAKESFPIFPASGGAQTLRIRGSRPRTYWEKYWIQLYLEIVSWLDPAQQAQAETRLKELEVEYYKYDPLDRPRGT